jgi:hypothetical protein
VATHELSIHPFPAQERDVQTIHICPLCKSDVASGTDANGLPTVCAGSEHQAARLRILPMAFRKKAKASSRRRRP